MKHLLLATALIALPVGAFTAYNLYTTGPSVAAASSATASAGLGDMTAFSGIVTDVQTIAATGDLAAAKARIKDFETARDEQAATLRPMERIPPIVDPIDSCTDAHLNFYFDWITRSKAASVSSLT